METNPKNNENMKPCKEKMYLIMPFAFVSYLIWRFYSLLIQSHCLVASLSLFHTLSSASETMSAISHRDLLLLYQQLSFSQRNNLYVHRKKWKKKTFIMCHIGSSFFGSFFLQTTFKENMIYFENFELKLKRNEFK